MQTLFHLIRHGHYGLVDRALGGRAPGHGLSAPGHAQAARLAADLAATPFASIVSSPMQRATETAAPLAAARGLDTGIEPDLTELDCGEWTGLTFEALRDRPDWQRWNRFRSTAGIPGGETMLAVQARSVAALHRLSGHHGDAELAVVTHADVIKSVLMHVLGIPLDHMGRLEIAPASRSLVAWHDDTARVLAVNLPPGA